MLRGKLADCFPSWSNAHSIARTRHTIGILEGEGIGPEVTQAALMVLEAAKMEIPIEIRMVCCFLRAALCTSEPSKTSRSKSRVECC